MVAVGITSKDEIEEFECVNGHLFCSYNKLVSLEIPEGVKEVYCHGNILTELIIPNGVTHVYCHNNKLSELIIPESVECLKCDKEVSGLDEFIDKIYIELC